MRDIEPNSIDFESLIEQFEEAWSEEVVPELRLFAPQDARTGEARQALLELVLVDLEYRWKRYGREAKTNGTSQPDESSTSHRLPLCPRLEDYCCCFKELGALDDLPLGAVVHEFHMRRRAGDSPNPSEYMHRFPHLALELEREFGFRIPKSSESTPVSKMLSTLISPGDVDSSLLGPEDSGDILENPKWLTSLQLPARELTEGEMLGKYRVGCLLGRGGMGAVYRAYDSHLRRDVALKIPFFGNGQSAEMVRRFLREARTAAGLSHPNICRVFDVGVIDRTLVLTMELLEGRSLEELIKPNLPLPVERVIVVARQVALALQEAHEHGIVHRDLKPANIMIDAKGQSILMDFGLARIVEGGDIDLTRDGELLGTPAYMSPEQVRGNSREVGPATDIYSLGVVMYRLLTGRRPFDGILTAVLAAIPVQVPSSPSKINCDIPSSVEAICLKAMSKSPSDRFASAAELAAALAGVNVQKRPRWNSRSTSTVLCISLAVGLCAVALLLAVGNWQTHATSSTFHSASVISPGPDSKLVPPAISGSDNRVVVKRTKFPEGAAVTAEAQLSIHLQRAERQSGYEVLGDKSLPLRAKDKVQLHVTLSGPSYLYVFWIDTHGQCQRVWPEDAAIADIGRQQPLRELWWPPEATPGQKQKMIALDDATGLETILIATSDKPQGAAALQPIESVQLDLAHFDQDQQKLISFRPEAWQQTQRASETLLLPKSNGQQLVAILNDRDRGIGGIVETIKSSAVPFNDFTKRLDATFVNYTGLVFSHE